MVLGFTWGGLGDRRDCNKKLAGRSYRGQQHSWQRRSCIHRFESGLNATVEAAALEKAESYNRADLDPKKVAGLRCPGAKIPWKALRKSRAQQLVNPSLPATKG